MVFYTIILGKKKSYFMKYNKNTYIVPNGVDTELYKDIVPNSDNSIIFMGGVGYPPNADAVDFHFLHIETLNRTILELKLKTSLSLFMEMVALNRTILELK